MLWAPIGNGRPSFFRTFRSAKKCRKSAQKWNIFFVSFFRVSYGKRRKKEEDKRRRKETETRLFVGSIIQKNVTRTPKRGEKIDFGKTSKRRVDFARVRETLDRFERFRIRVSIISDE